MEHNQHQFDINKLSKAGLLVTLGIIYGDIGTSPLYVMDAIIGDNPIVSPLILGGLSCIFWTLTILTTIKYVILTLRADNKGEGGTFALYALIRRRRNRYLIYFALIGGSALLADSIITPPISVSAAVEGFSKIDPSIPILPIVIGIIILLFIVQSFGTRIMGNAFGPIMLIWFLMMGVLGFRQIILNPSILQAINPYYAYNLLIHYSHGFWFLGSVFLCTTGAEALYSDLGHCGRSNIRVSWILVKACLLLNYFGQGAWLMNQGAEHATGVIPFYAIMPQWFLIYGIIIATLAAVIASQAMITGAFTTINEAMKLNVWPKMKVYYTSMFKGQIYVPAINWVLMICCIGVVLHFKQSSRMEAAYGLAINLSMLMTTCMFTFYLMAIKKIKMIWVAGFASIYLLIEGSFLVANLAKFLHGGYLTLIIMAVMMLVMVICYHSRIIKNRLTEFINFEPYFSMISELSHDDSIPKYATHLIYLTTSPQIKYIESKIIYSIFQKQPKKADIYWLLHIDVVDEPYVMEYKVTELVVGKVVRVDFKLGFRVEQKVNLYFRRVVEDMVSNNELDFTSRYSSLNKRNLIGDFRFVVLEKHLSHENDLPFFERIIMKGYFILKHLSLTEQSAFNLDTSSVTIEKVPLVISPVSHINLKRTY